MKQDINFSQFCDAFRSMDRNENFSYSAKRMLFDYLEEQSEETGTEYNLDIIEVCCDFTEMDNETIMQEYKIESEDDIEDYLNKNTMLIGETKEGWLFLAF